MRIVAFLVCLLPVLAYSADLSKAQRAEVEARIKPYGSACLPTDDCAGGASAVAAVARSGEAVYDAACSVCHASGVAGAPKYADAAAWGSRIAKGKDALYTSGIMGVAGTGMIARGGCADCSDDDIRAAVDFMVDSSR